MKNVSIEIQTTLFPNNQTTMVQWKMTETGYIGKTLKGKSNYILLEIHHNFSLEHDVPKTGQ